MKKLFNKIPPQWLWVIVPLFIITSYGAIKFIEYTQIKWEQNQQQK